MAKDYSDAGPAECFNSVGLEEDDELEEEGEEGTPTGISVVWPLSVFPGAPWIVVDATGKWIANFRSEITEENEKLAIGFATDCVRVANETRGKITKLEEAEIISKAVTFDFNHLALMELLSGNVTVEDANFWTRNACQVLYIESEMLLCKTWEAIKYEQKRLTETP